MKRECNCENCTSFKKNMCIHKNPKLQNKPFGFPFHYEASKTTCPSWKEKTLDDFISWEHLG